MAGWAFEMLGGAGIFLSLGLQVAAAIHAVKSGRQQWLWIILFFPMIGCAVYFFSEVLPSLRGSPSLRRMGTDLIQLVDPGRSLRQLQEEVEVCDTFKNRQALARGLVAARRYDEAIGEYLRCLNGTFQDDPCALLELAHAYFCASRYGDATATLERLEKTAPKFRVDERQLLLARTFEQAGDRCRALEQYAAIADVAPGEEARCRYALLLEQSGQTEKACQVFRQILFRSRRSPYYYRRMQKEWIRIAKQRLAKSPSP
jgi:hypothetical protein